MKRKPLLITSLVVFVLFGLLLAISTTGDVTRQVRAEALNSAPVPHSSLTATQSTTPTEPFSFVVTADMRNFAGPGQYDTSQYFRGAVEAISRTGTTAFMVSTGDLDPPANVEWSVRQYLGQDYLWYPVVGNHEISPTDYMPYLRAYNYDLNGSAPPNIVRSGPAGCPETTFSFDYQNAHFVVLNEYCDTAGDDATDGDIPDVLYNWLVDDLNATSQPHIFVFGHEPAYPQPDADNGRLRHQDDSLNAHPINRDRFWRLLADQGVVAYICGHTHNYSAVNIDGVWQLDAGHARGLGDPGAPSTFIKVRVNGEAITFDAFRDDANGGSYTLAHSGILAGPRSANRIEPIGQLGGPVSALTISGYFAYTNVGPNLFIFDVSVPAHPKMVGQTGPILGSYVADVVRSGDYVYVADNTGLHIINVALPSMPYQVSFRGGYLYDVAVGNGYAYLAEGDGVTILDVSNPAAPIQVGYYSTWPVSPATLARSGTYLYVQYGAGDWGESIDVVNISDPAHPVKTGRVLWSRYSYDLDIVGTYLYSAASISGLRIFDVSNPAVPTEIGSYTRPGLVVAGVEVSGNRAYVIDRGENGGGLVVLDVSNPAAITELGSYNTSGASSDIALIGNEAYIAHGNLLVLDVANPAAITEAESFASPVVYAPDLQVSGGYAYLAEAASGLNIFAVANPTLPAKVGHYDLPGGARNVFISGSRAYVVDGYGDLHIINISNPASPAQLGFYDVSGGGGDITVVGNYAYLAKFTSVSIINVSNPVAPVEVGVFPMPYSVSATGVAVAGNYLYIAGNIGLHIVDVTNPAAPALTGVFTTPVSVVNVAVAGNYAYVDSWGSLYIVNITDPAHPALTGYFPVYGIMETEESSIVVDGTLVYVTGVYAGVHVADVSNPAAPVEVAYYNPPGKAMGVDKAGSYIYTTFNGDGLVILWLAPTVSGVIPTSGGVLNSPGDSTTYTFPSGSVNRAALITDTLIVTHTGRYSGRIPTHIGLTGVGHAFENTGIYSSTGQLAQPGPFTVTVAYEQAQLSAAIEAKLALYSWDGLQWIKESSSVVDTTNNIVTATLDHFGLWAVLGESHRVFLPAILKAH
jgi:hypothetical protein